MAVAFAAVAAIAAVVVFVLPTPVARWALARQLQEWGISAQGLKTLDVDLAEGEVWLGPVQFAASDREPAQLVEFGFDVSLRSLLEHRVLFNRILIRGLDVHVRRVLNGPITVNGIEISQFLPKPSPAGQPKSGRPSRKEEPAQKKVAADVEATSSPWAAGIDDFELRNSRLLVTSADGGELAIDVARLGLHGFRTWTADQPGTFSLVGEANGIGFTLEGEARPFADIITVAAEGRIDNVELSKIRRFTGPLMGLKPDQGTLDGHFDATMKLFSDGRIEGTAKGGAKLSAVHMTKPGAIETHLAEGNLDGDLSFAVAADDDAHLQGRAEVALEKGRVQRPDGSAAGFESASLSLSDLDVGRKGGGEGIARLTRTDGKLKIEIAAADARLPGPSQTQAVAQAADTPEKTNRMHADEMRLDAHALNSGAEGGRFFVQLTGSAAITRLGGELPGAVAAQPIETSIGTFETTLHEATLRLADGAPPEWRARLDATAGELSGKIGDDAADAGLKSLALRNVSAGGDMQMTAEDLTLDTLTVRVTRRLIDALAAGKAEPEGEAAQTEAEAARQPAQPAGIALDRLTVTGQSRVRIQDKTVQPPVDVQVNLDTLTVQSVDTAHPDEHTEFELAGSLGDLSEISVSGWATPLGAQRDFNISMRAQGVQLYKFSGYTAQALGLVIDRGTLKVDVNAEATDGRLKALADGVVRNLDLAKPAAGEGIATAAGSNLPIGLVLALLEDADRKIELRVPVSGNLNAPKFDLSDAIERALTGAVRNVVRGALDVVFAPALIANALIEGDGGTDELSKPLSFRPGSAELGGSARESAERLAQLLEKRPKLTVEICGRATAQDASHLRTRQLNQAMLKAGEAGGSVPSFGQQKPTGSGPVRPELEDLAAARTRAVRRHLLDEGVAPSQISECRPTVDASARGEPGVMVTLQAG